MPFVRRELGKSLRLRRIPDLHIELDDTAERGTRVMQLLDELESGRAEPDTEPPAGETLPTPIARVHHEGDAAEEPPSAVIPPEPRRRRGRPANAGHPSTPMTVDLSPYLGSVPEVVVERIEARGASSR